MADYRLDFDFVAVPLEVFRSGLDAVAIAAYSGLRSLARYRDRTQSVKVTDKLAAETAGMSERAFRDARTRLREAGWVEWRRTGRENEYTIITVRAHVKTEVCSAPNAEQSGATGGSDQQQAPNTSIKEIQVEDVKKKDTAPAAAPTGEPFQLGPYIDLHIEVMGDIAPTGTMAAVFPQLEERGRVKNPDIPLERIRAQILKRQRNYLETLKGEAGGGRFLNYHKFGETFATWAKAAPAARPLAGLASGKAYHDGMDDLNRKGA